MIPQAAIVAWGAGAPWPTPEQVEQDLVLSRLIVEIANHPYLGKELIFRGGTCLHKLHLHPARRYSEDLDYVRKSADPIGPLLDALRHVGQSMGMTAASDVGRHPGMIFRASFESDPGQRMRVKVEMNTYERSPADPLVHQDFAVASPWFSGSAPVQTFSRPELVTTKLRALYQRKKGRDLFDLWLALTELGVAPDEILRCFPPYRPDNYTSALAVANLRQKLQDRDFRHDLDPLVQRVPAGYDVETAGETVIRTLLEKM